MTREATCYEFLHYLSAKGVTDLHPGFRAMAYAVLTGREQVAYGRMMPGRNAFADLMCDFYRHCGWTVERHGNAVVATSPGA